jgi:undecaprenyl-diphosphatase
MDIVMSMLSFQIFISTLSGPVSMFCILGILAFVLRKIHDNKEFYQILFTGTLALSTSYTLKFLFKIPRPTDMLVYEGDYRFPSGHATMAAVVMTLAIHYIHKHVQHTFLRRMLYTLSVVWYILISYSRLYLHVHYPVDVIAGGIIGVLSSVLILKLFTHLRYYR